MDNALNREQLDLERQIAIQLYITALDAGDDEAVAVVLNMALQDAELDSLLTEIDLALDSELGMSPVHLEKPIMANLLGQHFPETVIPRTAVAPVEWNLFPLREMMSRGYFDDLPEVNSLKKKSADLDRHAEELMKAFMRPLGRDTPVAVPVLWKKTLTTRAARAMDSHALSAWTMRVLRRAAENPPACIYNPEVLTWSFLVEIAHLSALDDGPVAAQRYLNQHGISLIIEPHLPRTHLDGAAIALWEERPVIGLTLRHDRLDNFWFCLLHELSHLQLHFRDEAGNFTPGEFYDDFDNLEESGTDPREKEADEVAGEALIPDAEWRKAPVSLIPSPQAVERLARRLHIHPAIVAGRVRHRKNYRVLNNMVGQGEVRKHFSNTIWKLD